MFNFSDFFFIFVTEELRNPNKNFPLAVWLSIPLVTGIYILVNIAYLTVMTPSEIISSDAVAITYGYRTLGSFAWLIPVGVVCSTFGTANGSMFTAARLTGVASRHGHLPKVISYISTEYYTPTTAILFNSLIACLLMSPGGSNFSTMLNFFNFTQWIFYGMCTFAVVVLRYKEPFKSMERDFKVPIVIPILGFLMSAYLVVAPVIEEPDLAYLYASLIVLAGLVFYIPVHVFKWRGYQSFQNKVTLGLQKWLSIAPEDNEFTRKLEQEKEK